MPVIVNELKEFLPLTRKKDAKYVTILKKYRRLPWGFSCSLRLRCKRYLYLYTMKDFQKHQKIIDALPPALEKREVESPRFKLNSVWNFKGKLAEQYKDILPPTPPKEQPKPKYNFTIDLGAVRPWMHMRERGMKAKKKNYLASLRKKANPPKLANITWLNRTGYHLRKKGIEVLPTIPPGHEGKKMWQAHINTLKLLYKNRKTTKSTVKYPRGEAPYARRVRKANNDGPYGGGIKYLKKHCKGYKTGLSALDFRPASDPLNDNVEYLFSLQALFLTTFMLVLVLICLRKFCGFWKKRELQEHVLLTTPSPGTPLASTKKKKEKCQWAHR